MERNCRDGWEEEVNFRFEGVEIWRGRAVAC